MFICKNRNKKEWIAGRIKVKPIYDGYYEPRKYDIPEV